MLPGRSLAFVPEFENALGEIAAVGRVLLEDTGSLLVVGGFTSVDGELHEGIVRVSQQGVVDHTYAPTIVGGIADAQLTPDGGCVVVGDGITSVNGVSRTRIAKLNADGSLSDEFAMVLSSVLYPELYRDPSGRVMLRATTASFTVGGVTRAYMARFTLAGVLDTTFNVAANGLILALAFQSDGRILVGGGFTNIAGGSRPRLARLNTNGTRDTSFAPVTDGNISGIVVAPDDSFYCFGNFDIIGGVSRSNIARLSANGVGDSGFTAAALVERLPYVRAPASGGFFCQNRALNQALAIMRPDGSVDTSEVYVDISELPNYSGGITVNAVLQVDGAFFVGGSWGAFEGAYHPLLKLDGSDPPDPPGAECFWTDLVFVHREPCSTPSGNLLADPALWEATYSFEGSYSSPPAFAEDGAFKFYFGYNNGEGDDPYSAVLDMRLRAAPATPTELSGTITAAANTYYNPGYVNTVLLFVDDALVDTFEMYDGVEYSFTHVVTSSARFLLSETWYYARITVTPS